MRNLIISQNKHKTTKYNACMDRNDNYDFEHL